MIWRSSGLARLLAVMGCLAFASASQAQTGAPRLGVRDMTQVPKPPGRLFVPGQMIVKVEDGVDRNEVLNRVLAGNKESFQDGAIVAQDLSNGAVLVDVSSIVRRKESSSGPGLFELEPAGGLKEAATPGSLDDLIARLSAEPGVIYAQKNYLLHLQQSSADTLNSMIAGAPARAPEPDRTPPPPAPPSRPAPPVAEQQTPAAKLPNDPLLALQWHLHQFGSDNNDTTSPGAANFPAAWSLQTGTSDVIVAVLDTGIVADHEDFAGSANLQPGYDMVSLPEIGADGDGRDSDPYDVGDGSAADECFAGSAASEPSWHGSHVAGIIGGLSTDNGVGIAGGSWQARVLPVRVLGKCGGSMQDIVDGILWAAGLPVDGAPVNPTPANIINMSLGGPGTCTPFVQDAIDTVVAKGVTVIVAAGNETQDASGFEPSGCQNLISVAAGDARGHLSPYSNFGQTVDLMAPGGDTGRDDNADGYADGVLSVVKDQYVFMNGTSMASPVVAGAAALLKSANAQLTPADIETALKQYARPRSAEECGQPCGAGLLDIGLAMACISAPTGQECTSLVSRR